MERKKKGKYGKIWPSKICSAGLIPFIFVESPLFCTPLGKLSDYKPADQSIYGCGPSTYDNDFSKGPPLHKTLLESRLSAPQNS